jgi:DNA processing protein
MTSLPRVLDVRGTLGEHAVSVAIVGARAALASDLEQAGALARAVAGRGGVVVSGGAIGVDSAAHRGALAAGGATVVVLGTGIDVPYPVRNTALFDAIAASRTGAVVSSFPPGATPRAGNFVARNAIIAALADLVIVVGARGRSGSLHTADAARRLGRQLAAVPGGDASDHLLASGAALIESLDDLDRCLAGSPRHRVAELPDHGSDAHVLLEALSDRDPRDLDDLIARSGLSLRAVQRALADLELRGLVLLAPGQAYVRAPLTPAAPVAVTA